MRTLKGEKYNYCGPNTRLEERLARGDEGMAAKMASLVSYLVYYNCM